MSNLNGRKVDPAPATWVRHCWHTENRLHQLAPYIGKLKSSIAAHLVERYSSPGDVVLDPFCGSGTIPLECARLGRHVVASDANPYAVVLTRAKLLPPASVEEALGRLEDRLAAAETRTVAPDDQIPEWVRKFFHPATLRKALQFADECIAQDDYFLLACLLGVLHHQRPGFLSFPSSHLVPYLRDRNFPRDQFPELYEERDLRSRMIAKVRRALREPLSGPSGAKVQQVEIGKLRLMDEVDAILTSPPYMNALDYVRDNRLRMWFLDRNTTNYAPEPTDRRTAFEMLTTAFTLNAVRRLRPGGRSVLVVGETVRRKKMQSHPAGEMLKLIQQLDPGMFLEQVIEDVIPDVRRTRRDGAATKKELIVVLRRTETPR